MEETILTWNLPNWITVLLMVFLGFALFGVIAKVAGVAKGKSNA